MSISVQHKNQNSLTNLSDEKIELLKRTICVGATNDELELFIHACKRTELDPFMRQIYFVKMGGKMTIQTGIDGYRLIAERSNKYMPGRETTYIYDNAGKLFSATSYVKKLGPDNQWHEIAATAILSEYVGFSPLWKSKPHIMLAKCSESIALRKAFPADLSGVYTKEELDQAEVIEPAAKPSACVISEELFSAEEMQELESLMEQEGTEYRDDLLKYFSNIKKMSTHMTDFSGIPKKYYPGIVKSIKKRKEERNKKKIEDEKEVSEEEEMNTRGNE